MRRGLALACALGGCSFSTTVEPGNDLVLDARPSTDGALDAPADATVGSEAMVQATMTFTSAADIYLRTSLAPNENTNGADFFIVDGDNIATGLVRFDLAAIPTSAVVMMAELMLYDDGDSGMENTVYPLLESWDEATATSNQRATGMAWLGAGATPPSRGATAIGTFTPATANTTYTFALTTSVVQGWVSAPATNFGVAITTTNSDGSRFASRERSVAAQRPALRVIYQQ
jgi:hypothetical protein